MGAEEEAVGIVRSFGLPVDRPVVLGDSNNLVVWLRPSPVVAKIGRGQCGRMALELSVVQHLVRSGAPVVGPSDLLPQQVHENGHSKVTFWRYQPHEGIDAGGAELAPALAKVHDALQTYATDLPLFDAELSEVAALLADRDRAPALAATDRSTLLSALRRFWAELQALQVDHWTLHGSRHTANALVTGTAPPFRLLRLSRRHKGS